MTYNLSTHKITSGSWKSATWTFDEATQTITTSTGVVLYLQREVDWETTPQDTYHRLCCPWYTKDLLGKENPLNAH